MFIRKRKLGLTGELRYLSYVPRIIASGQAATNADFGTGPITWWASRRSRVKLGVQIGYSF